MLALLKDFDLAWPRVTTTAMSWSETANLGIAVTAPQCYWPGFGFYHNWALTMTFPARRPPPPPFPTTAPACPPAGYGVLASDVARPLCDPSASRRGEGGCAVCTMPCNTCIDACQSLHLALHWPSANHLNGFLMSRLPCSKPA